VLWPYSTTGGAGGTTTTVSNLASFTAAVQAEGKAVVVVSGNLSGAVKVNVTSNKSIIGKSGSSMSRLSLLKEPAQIKEEKGNKRGERDSRY